MLPKIKKICRLLHSLNPAEQAQVKLALGGLFDQLSTGRIAPNVASAGCSALKDVLNLTQTVRPRSTTIIARAVASALTNARLRSS